MKRIITTLIIFQVLFAIDGLYNNAAAQCSAGSISATSTTICSGTSPGKITGTAAATGTINYIWVKSTDGVNFTNISGATAQDYTPPTLTVDTWYARRYFNTTFTCVGTTADIKITVTAVTTITSQPSASTICQGDNTTFSVAATGAGLGYQWQENQGGGFSNLADAGVYSNTTTDELTITGATTTMNGYTYRCVVTSTACTNKTSNAATLTVETTPSVTTAPIDQEECVGDDATFTVTGSGTITSYQWQENNGGGFANIGGANSASYTKSSVAAADDGYLYRVLVIGNKCATATSAQAELTTKTTPSVTTSPSSQTVCVGDKPTFTVTHSGDVETYTWQEDNGGGFANMSNGGIYLQVDQQTFKFTGTGVTAGMDGYLYRVSLGNSACTAVNSSSATMTVNTQVSVTNPSATSGCTTTDATFSTTATGTGATVRWQESTGGAFANLADGGVYSGTGTSTLTISSPPASMNGYKYRAQGSGTCPATSTSLSATLTVISSPVVTVDPSSVTVCTGTGTSFSVTATGSISGYQWQENSGSGFNNLSDGGIYSGSTTTTLTLSSTTTTLNGRTYRVLVNSASCPTATSAAATLTVQSNVAITTQPVNRTVCAGSNTTFNCVASGGTVSYQWQVSTNGGGSFSDIGSATSSTLSLTAVTASMTANQYRCFVTSTCGTPVTSTARVLTVRTTPAITTQPSNSTVCEGDDATFTVVHSGDATSYQWQLSTGGAFSNISGATSISFTRASTTAAMDGNKYRVVVVNTTCSNVTSDGNATLTVETQPAITTQPSDGEACEGDDAGFSVTASGSVASYQWQEDSGSGFGNMAGETASSLVVSSVTTGMDGNKYRVVVKANTCSDVTSNSVTDAVLSVSEFPNITSQPANSTVCEGSNTSFSVTHTGDFDGYQWQVNTGSGFSDISGATNSTLSLTAVTTGMSGNKYRVVIENAICGDVSSNGSATLTVETQPSIAIQPASVTECSGNSATFSVVASGTVASRQWQEDTGSGFANLAGKTATSLTLSGVTTASDGNKYRVVILANTCSDVFSNTSSDAILTVVSPVNITTQPSNATVCEGSNTSFSVAHSGDFDGYQWQVDNGSGFTNISGATTTTLSLNAVASSLDGNDYRLVISNSICGNVNSNSVSLTVNDLVDITTEPSDANACVSDNTTFTVVVSGASPQYQWQVDDGSGYANVSGPTYSGGTSATLTVATGVTAGMDGFTYKCLISSSACAGTDVSSEAVLNVSSGVAITTQPSSATKCVGDNVTFSTVASGGTVSYQWQLNSGSGYGDIGTATSSSLSLTNVASGLTGNKYRCIVTSTCGGPLTSNEATLTVNTTPSITANPGDEDLCISAPMSLTVTSSGTNLSYQWQEDQGSGFANLSNAGIYSQVTQATLKVSAVSIGMDGYEYRVVVSNTGCATATSAAALLTILSAPAITSQPTDQTVCEGSTAQFTLAHSNGTSFQWQENKGSGWSALSNNAIYSGAGSNSLSIATAASFNGYLYRCVLQGNCNPSVTSDEVELSVKTNPAITSNPSSTTICEGSNTSFTVASSGTVETFQWQVSTNNGTSYSNLASAAPYSDVDKTTLVISSASTGIDGFLYRCEVDNDVCSAVQSSGATLTVEDQPSVSVEPASTSACTNPGTASFSVTASGSIDQYQWQVNTGAGFSNISGANNSSLSLTGLAASDDGNKYRVVVEANTCSDVTTNATTDAVLTVKTIPSITTAPSDKTICEGSGTSFAIASSGDVSNINWQVDDGSGFSNLSNDATYSGTTGNTLSITGSSTSLDGFLYRASLSNSACATVNSASAELTVETQPAITAQPSSSEGCAGDDVAFSVTATGTIASRQWQEDSGSGFGDLAGETGTSVTLTSVTAGMDGNKYRVVIKANTCSDVVSNASTDAILTVKTTAAITTQPANSTICEGSNTSFSVSHSGDADSYQWQVNTGAGFSDISGATSASLSLTAVTTAMSGNKYRVVIFNSACGDVTSNGNATLTVETQPAITAQPSSSEGCAGDDVAFSVTATGTIASRQWQEDSGSGFGDLAGETGTSVTLTSVTAGMDGNKYRVVIKANTCSDVVSNASADAVLTVKTTAAITTQPANSTICEGSNTSFSVSHSGDADSYQWQVNTGAGFSDISGATSASLSLTAVTTAMSGNKYRVVIFNSACGDVTSNGNATLTVETQPAITAQPSSSEGCAGDDVAFSVTATGTIASRQWQEDSGSGFGDLAGETGTSVTLTSVTAGMDGNKYRVVIKANTCSDVVSNASTDAILTVKTTAAITTQPANSTICEGSNTSFSVTHSGDADSYQWQVNTGAGFSDISGATSASLSLTAVTTAMSGNKYRVVIFNSACGDVTSNGNATLTVETQPAITAQPSSSEGCAGDDVAFSVTATGTIASRQWQEDSGSGFGDLAGETGTSVTLTSVTAGMDGNKYRVVIKANTCSDVVSNASTDAILTVKTTAAITTQPSNSTVCEGSNTSFSVSHSGDADSYQWQVNTGAGFSDISGATSASLSLTAVTTAMSGNKYRVVIFNSACGDVTSNGNATLTVETQPAITAQPSSSEGCAGDDVAFSVTATGTIASRQWQEDSGSGFGDLAGETGTSVTLTSVTAGMDGNKYRVVIKANTCSDVVSNASTDAILTVKTTAAITTQPANSTICEGSNTSFSVSHSGDADSYQWQVNTGAGFSDISGATSASLSLTAVTTAMSGNKYRVVIFNSACGDVTSNGNATLTVETQPAITAQPSSSEGCAGDDVAFSVTATGTIASRQWQEDSGSGFGDLAGETGTSVTLTSVTAGMDGNKYRVIIKANTCSDVVSNASTDAVLTVKTTPVVTTNPTDAKTCEGISTGFTLSTSGTVDTYQWQVDDGSGFVNVSGASYSGGTTDKLTVNTPDLAMDGFTYKCLIANSACASGATSGSADLTVQDSIRISSQPGTVTICETSNTTFSVSASGDLTGYQWQENSGSGFGDLANTSPYSNVDNATVSISSVPASMDANTYRVVIFGDACPDLMSNNATLNVEVTPAITTQPSSQTLCEGSSVSFTIASTGDIVSYRWQEDSGSGFINISNGGIYSVSSTKLTIDPISASMSGNIYRMYLVGNACADEMSNNATLTVETKPAVTADASSVTLCEGSSTSFTVSGSGDIAGYQWQENTGSGFSDLSSSGIYSNTNTVTMSISSVSTSMDNYTYRAVIKGNTCPDIVSNSSTTALLTVETKPAATTPSNSTICEGSGTTFNSTITGTVTSLVWQEDQGSGFGDLSNGGIYGGATTDKLVLSGSNTGMDGYLYRIIAKGNKCSDATSASAKLTVETKPAITANPSDASICPGSNNTFTTTATGTFSGYQWQEDQGSGFVDLSDGGVYSGSSTANLKITSATSGMDGYLYRAVALGQQCNDAISSSAKLTIYKQPAVTSQPKSDTICLNDDITFSITGSGQGISFRWQEDQGAGFTNLTDGGIYSGSATSDLTITSAPTSIDGYLYRCVVSGTCTPNATSNQASLNVQSPPTVVAQPSNTSICEGLDANFGVTATGTNIKYQWQEDQGSGFADLANNATYSGVTTASLDITAIDQSMQGYGYRVVITNDACSPAISNTATLTVLINSTTPTTVTANGSSICIGDDSELSATGGIHGSGASIEWYTATNGGGVNFGTGAGPITVTPSATTTYFVRREGTCNTTSDATVVVTVNPLPVADFTTNNTCDGQITKFFDKSSISAGSITKYNWDLGDAGSATTKNVAYQYSSTGTYTVILTVTSAKGCIGTTSQTVTVFEQPTADFTVGNVCLGTQSKFTNKSSVAGSATLSYDWEFGDGTGTATATNPSYTYLASGSFTSRLIVTTSDGCVDSTDKTSTVYVLPDADFSYTNACLNDAVAFSNKSKIGSGTLSYSWDFGDLATSTATNPTHTYSAANTFDVTLLATSDKGCKANSVQTVETYPLPSVDFTAVNACKGSDVVFTNKTTVGGGAGLSYLWDFGDGNTSTFTAPTHAYASAGSFTVTLTATSSNGCKDKFSKTVTVYALPKVDFSASTVCDGIATSFTNNTTVGGSATLSYIWRFGDKDTSMRKNPAHIYPGSGTYTARLIAASSDGCSDSLDKIITIRPLPKASFKATNACLSDSVEFQNLSTISSGSLSSNWIFDDGFTSSLTDPNHLYTSAGTYNVELKVKSIYGCRDSVTKKLIVYPMPQPSFTTGNVCDKESVSFTNNTVVKTGTKYTWNFGDGFGSTNQDPVHTYVGPGTYSISLVATTANGCTETAPVKSVTIYPRAVVNFTASDVCDNDSVHFNNNSKVSSGTMVYNWNLGDKQTSSLTSPVHLYDTFGVYTITLIATTNNSCSDSLTKTVEVYPQPTAKYKVDGVCDLTSAIFKDKSIIPGGAKVQRNWTFGDGFSSNLTSPTHAYSGAGTYTTKMIIETSDGCRDSASHPINVWPVPVSDFTVFDVCFGQNAVFADKSSITTGTIVDWVWNFGDASSVTGVRNPQHFYLTDGIYEVQLQVESDSGCTNVSSQKVEIFPKPTVSFNFNDTCAGLPVSFNNLTVEPTGMFYQWTFGDGEKSTLKSPVKVYKNNGQYDIELLGTTIDGCTDIDSQTITIHSVPFPVIVSNTGKFQFCEGDEAILTVTDTMAGNSYVWSTTETTTSITITKTDNYEVISTSIFGCVASADETVTVFDRPIADAGKDAVISKGYPVTLVGDGADFFAWSPSATLNDSTLQQPVALPLENTTYTLIVTDFNGCSDTDFVDITVETDYNITPHDVFTPNGDGINDLWVIDNITTYPDCQVFIVTRIGDFVLETPVGTAYNNDWDGTLNGKELPTGAYFYLIKCADGSNITGTVSIIR